MAVFYTEGENKIRPGVYQRHTNAGFLDTSSTTDGICAIPIQAHWGPLGKVIKNTLAKDLQNNYGTGTYGSGYTVPAALEMFNGGASTVYTYRMGTGGAAGTKVLNGGEDDTGKTVTITAKYVGSMPISVAVQNNISDASQKQLLVYAGTTNVETWNFTADTQNEGANLIAAVAGSNYITAAVTGSAAPAVVALLAVASGALAGGTDPTVTNESYSAAFDALEPYYYNTIALDVDDNSTLTLSLLLQSYLDNAYLTGKLGIAVVGEATTVAYATRLTHAKTFNDSKVVYLGGGWMAGTESKDGVLAICYTAGVIASTPSNQGITHLPISEATDLMESLTFAQYEQAVESGMLMISMAPDGSIWYDSGITTLVDPNPATQDNGWKKIRRVKVRYELINRLDIALAPKVGQVSADSDGISDIVQTGQRVLDAMSSSEGKLLPGAVFEEDPQNPYTGDSAWFIIQADDLDSLEKIYLQYQFRYSMNS